MECLMYNNDVNNLLINANNLFNDVINYEYDNWSAIKILLSGTVIGMVLCLMLICSFITHRR